MGISNPSLTDHVSNETIFSAPCVRFIRDRTHSDHSDRLDLATARATSIVLSVRVSVQLHTNQQLVRATIGALVLGCPSLGNSCTRSYHAMSVDIPSTWGQPAPVIRICGLACKYF